MKIETIHEKGSGTVNEDNIFSKENMFGVFDGVSSLVKFVYEDGKTGGLVASSIAKEVFEKEDGGLTELAKKANALIKKEMLRRNVDISDKKNLWSTTVAVVKINKDNFEWVQLADSLIVVVYEDASFKLLVTDYDLDKKTMLMWKELADKKTENIRQVLNDQIIKVRETMNVAYGVLSGEDEMVNFLKSGTESLENVRSIIIFTDGLFIPKEDPKGEDNFSLFVKLFNEGGLEKIRNYVRGLEDSDPKCWKYIRFKQHDDIGAVAVTFE